MATKKKRKKPKLSTIIVVIILLAGLSLMLYPTISNYIYSMYFRRAISRHEEIVATMDDTSYERALADARAFNAQLASRSSFKLSEEEAAQYQTLLNVSGDGIMGYVVVPRVNISLPIYHGTSDVVLQAGIGHVEWSSLPVGGASTHAVISGHRGLPSTKLFTNIDQLEIGDYFAIHVLREELYYGVDSIDVVLPAEVDSLTIVPGEDRCTLVTCTPYGVNTHRLLVHGHRIDKPPEEYVRGIWNWITEHLATLLVLVVIIALLVIFLLIPFLKKKKKKKADAVNPEAAAAIETTPDQDIPSDPPDES